MSEIRIPNLIIIGAMKASTTLLYNMLGRHPDVWFPREKEPHYFTSPDYGKPEAYEAYLRHFSECPEGRKIVGEASTGYSKMPFLGDTPERIRAVFGQPRLIYILRDPVQRLISNFQHAFARGYYRSGCAVSAAVREDPIIVAASRYMQQLAAYENVFGTGSVLVVVMEELHRDPVGTMRTIERHLGIEPYAGWDAPLAQVNSAAAVQRSVVADRFLGRSVLLRRIGRMAPDWAKAAVVNTLKGRRLAAAVTAAEEAFILEHLADDLEKLQRRLGPRIDCWPSVQKLGLLRSPALAMASA